MNEVETLKKIIKNQEIIISELEKEISYLKQQLEHDEFDEFDDDEEIEFAEE